MGDPCEHLGKDESCTLSPTLVCLAWLDWSIEKEQPVAEFHPTDFCKNPDTNKEGYQEPCT